ncbi:hypothetical protein FRC11_007123, partial [Ceratobasidium sp. 423]
MKPKRLSDLVRSARVGPVVVINCHETRCDALIILPGQTDISHLPLPQFTYESAQHARTQIESSLRSVGIRERGWKCVSQQQQKDAFGIVLANLWKDVTKPILDFLGYA